MCFSRLSDSTLMGPVSPSSRVATAQRKLKLVNDPHVKAFTPRSVDCKLCDTTVELERTAEYDLTKWEDHKLTVHGCVLVCQYEPGLPSEL